eukprot:8050858-Pyramimonas_sp.AAC.1
MGAESLLTQLRELDAEGRREADVDGCSAALLELAERGHGENSSFGALYAAGLGEAEVVQVTRIF